jgi:transcriptional regulator with XRE-family HTH domain
MQNYYYIKEELVKQNKTLAWLAKETMVSKSYLSKLINNKVSDPGSAKLKAIHQVLGIVYEDTKDNKYKAFLIDANCLSITKYLFVAQKCLLENYDIYILYDNIKDNKPINIRRFYDYLNFTYSKIYLVNKEKLIRLLSRNLYDEIISFNDEFSFLKKIPITNVKLNNEEFIKLNNIKNKSFLFLSNDKEHLSILLKALKLKTGYAIDDFNRIDSNDLTGNSIIEKQLEIIKKVYHASHYNHIYLVGNEYLMFNQVIEDKDYQKGLIKFKEYLTLFDYIITIDFMINDISHKKRNDVNNKIGRLSKLEGLKIKSNDFEEIINIITKFLEEKK